MTIAMRAQAAERRAFKIDVSVPILFAFAALLCVLVILPISWLVYYSLTISDPATNVRAFTLEHFRALFTDPDFIEPLITTITVAVVFRRSVLCDRRADGLAGCAH